MVVVVVANISVWTGKTGRTGVCSVTAASQVRRLGCELKLQSAGERRGGGGGGMKITVILQTTGLALVVSEVWKCSEFFFHFHSL